MKKPRSDYLFHGDGSPRVGVRYTITDTETGTPVLYGSTTSRGRYRLPRDRDRAYDVTFTTPTGMSRRHYPAEDGL